MIVIRVISVIRGSILVFIGGPYWRLVTVRKKRSIVPE